MQSMIAITRTLDVAPKKKEKKIVLLAEDDPVLQALLEALSNAHPGRLLDPEAQLLLLMWVIFLSNL